MRTIRTIYHRLTATPDNSYDFCDAHSAVTTQRIQDAMDAGDYDYAVSLMFDRQSVE